MFHTSLVLRRPGGVGPDSRRRRLLDLRPLPLSERGACVRVRWLVALLAVSAVDRIAPRYSRLLTAPALFLAALPWPPARLLSQRGRFVQCPAGPIHIRRHVLCVCVLPARPDVSVPHVRGVESRFARMTMTTLLLQ